SPDNFAVPYNRKMLELLRMRICNNNFVQRNCMSLVQFSAKLPLTFCALPPALTKKPPTVKYTEVHRKAKGANARAPKSPNAAERHLNENSACLRGFCPAGG